STDEGSGVRTFCDAVTWSSDIARSPTSWLKPNVLQGHRPRTTMVRSTTAKAQRDGDRIFLNFAKWRKIAPVWDLDSRPRLSLASGRGETGHGGARRRRDFHVRGLPPRPARSVPPR